ncbi:hypothetical protein ACFL4R_01420 [Nitrospirota bacterium]
MEFHGHSCQSPDERDKLVREKIAKEDEMEAQATGDSRLIVLEHLGKLGYREDEIETDRPFEVTTGTHSDACSMDYLVTLGGRSFMAIKCTMAIESRERHVLSFCRCAQEHLIPMAVASDGLTAYVLDTKSGKRVSEGLDSMPDRDAALRFLDQNPPEPYPEAKAAKEKLILLAFETTLCQKPEAE